MSRQIYLGLVSIIISSLSVADWCSGQDWLFVTMPLKQRVIAANQAVTQELSEVKSSLDVLAYETVTHRYNIITDLDKEMQALNQRSKVECQVKINSPHALIIRRAKLRLDLYTLFVMQDVVRRLNQQMQKYASLMQSLERQRLELQYLQQRLTALNGEHPHLIETEVTVQNACMVVQTSKNLRLSYRPLLREELDHQALQVQEMTDDVLEPILGRAVKSCDLLGAQNPPVALTQEYKWWKFW